MRISTLKKRSYRSWVGIIGTWNPIKSMKGKSYVLSQNQQNQINCDIYSIYRPALKPLWRNTLYALPHVEKACTASQQCLYTVIAHNSGYRPSWFLIIEKLTCQQTVYPVCTVCFLGPLGWSCLASSLHSPDQHGTSGQVGGPCPIMSSWCAAHCCIQLDMVHVIEDATSRNRQFFLIVLVCFRL